MPDKKVCPVSRARGLDMNMRRWLQNPQKILKPFVAEGSVAVDFGCGPGFFTIDMASLAGEGGKVYAVDLQEEMLELLCIKSEKFSVAERIIPLKCGGEAIELAEIGNVDFILAFYVVHEVPDSESLFGQFYKILKPGGKALIAEPFFHVSKADYAKMLGLGQSCGFKVEKGPRIFYSRTAVFTKPE